MSNLQYKEKFTTAIIPDKWARTYDGTTSGSPTWGFKTPADTALFAVQIAKEMGGDRDALVGVIDCAMSWDADMKHARKSLDVTGMGGLPYSITTKRIVLDGVTFMFDYKPYAGDAKFFVSIIDATKEKVEPKLINPTHIKDERPGREGDET